MKFARYFLLLGAIIRHTSAAPSPQVLGPKVGIPECPGFEAASPDDFVREWQERKYDDWLDDWWKKHEREFRSKEGGFISAFAMWALGDPHWSCTMDGGPQCSLEGICDNDVLLAKGDDIRPAYFVLKSASNMRTYFQTQKDTFTTAAIEASLKKESWVVDFGLPAEGPNMVTAIKEAVIAAASIVGIIAAFASPAAPAAPFLVGAMMNSLAALAGGAASGLGPTVQPAKDLKFDTAAEIGRELGALLEEMVKKWTMSNNVLMKGQPYLDSGDLRAYVGGGLFINYQKPDQVMLLDKFSDLLTGHAINAMWSKQKSYIIGGRPCDYDYKIQKIDDPQTHYTACIDGRMYYLQAMTYGRKRDKVDKPWGADKLGNENYRNVKIEVSAACYVPSPKPALHPPTEDTTC